MRVGRLLLLLLLLLLAFFLLLRCYCFFFVCVCVFSDKLYSVVIRPVTFVFFKRHDAQSSFLDIKQDD